jgi:lipopolysaccharide export system permease protein
MRLIPIVDRHVLRQIATPLVAAMTVGLVVLLAERMVRLLDVTLGKKNSFGVVFELLAYLVPHYLGLALPAAMFLGLLFGFNRMSKDSEIDAFLAAGVGLHRLARPLIVLAVFLALVSFGIFGWLQPHTRYAYRSVLFTVKNVEVFYLAEEGVFMQAGSRTFILDRLSRRDNTFERIFLFDNRGPAGAETVTAVKGSLVQSPGESRPVLRLENGHRLNINDWPRFGDGSKPPEAFVGTFDIVDTPLGKLSNKVFRPRGDDQRELTLPELAAAIGNPPATIKASAIESEFHRRLVFVFTIMVLPILALPFAIGRRRGQRAYRFGIALVILIAYHEIIEQGAVMTRANGTSPYLTMWLPFALLSGFAVWRFSRACFHVGHDRLEPLVERLSDWVSAVTSRLGLIGRARPT